MNIIKMLYYDRIDVFEGINVNKTRKSKECDICLYWYFLNKGWNSDKLFQMDFRQAFFDQ